MHLSFILTIDKNLSDATTLGQRKHGSKDNEGLLRIPQSYSITGTSLLDCLVSYLGHSLWGRFIALQKSSQCILQLHPTGLNVKTVLFQTIKFSISMNIKFPNSSISNNPVEHTYAV